MSASHGISCQGTGSIYQLHLAAFHAHFEAAGHVAHHHIGAAPAGLVVLHGKIAQHPNGVIGIFARGPHNAHDIILLRDQEANFSVVHRQIIDGMQALDAFGSFFKAIVLNHQFAAVSTFHCHVALLSVDDNFVAFTADFDFVFLGDAGLVH